MRKRRVAFFVVFGVVLPLGACGTSALGVDVCEQIEDARCTRANQLGGCGIDFLAPFSDASGMSDANVTACVNFYSVACLHGIMATSVPNPTGTVSVQSCLDVINDGSCAAVINPWEAGGCYAFTLTDAGPEVDVAEATTIPVETGTVDVIVDAGMVDADGQMPLPL